MRSVDFDVVRGVLRSVDITVVRDVLRSVDFDVVRGRLAFGQLQSRLFLDLEPWMDTSALTASCLNVTHLQLAVPYLQDHLETTQPTNPVKDVSTTIRPINRSVSFHPSNPSTSLAKD